MPDEIERIVDEVLIRLGQGETQGVIPRAIAASRAPLQSALVLTEDLGRVSTVLGAVSRRQRQAISVFVGGSPHHRSSAAGFGELFFADDARHARTDLVSRFDTFLLFGVSLPTIARLAQLIISEPLELIAFNALSQSKAVLVEPMTNDPAFGRLPSGMKEEFTRLGHRLAGFGVREKQIMDIFGVEPPRVSGGAVVQGTRNGVRAQSALSVPNPSSERRTGPIILTVRDIQESVGPSSGLTITGPYRLTDLAREYVDKNGIRIEAE